jgi:hypothetical protein
MISSVDEPLGDVRCLVPGMQPLFQCPAHSIKAHGFRFYPGRRQPDNADARVKHLRDPEVFPLRTPQEVHVGFSIPIIGSVLDRAMRISLPLDEFRRHMREEGDNLARLIEAVAYEGW